MLRAVAVVALLAALPACGQTVSLGGSLGDKAVLVIDGTPRTVATGATVKGVTLVSVGREHAVVEVQGRRVTLPLGATQVNLGGAAGEASSGTQVVLVADGGGHFVAQGSVNGRAVRFLIDTGATYVSMGAAQARELGVDFGKGQRIGVSTGNGPVAAYVVKLASVQVGDVTLYDVDGLVTEHPLPAVLLGNSFLARFQMTRNNDLMTLTKRY